mmetsp:Transcript_26804/g.46505  ORF Transcript_26804/g.46505 Transcript_26804/m.46505 type:complete len:127 (+) Transcript_26804:138-518(+)
MVTTAADMLTAGATRPGCRTAPFGDGVQVTVPQWMLVGLLAALSIWSLSFIGLLSTSKGMCASFDEGGGYTRCGVWQDCRAVLSFTLGAILCRILFREEDGDEAAQPQPPSPAPSANKAQLYFFML